MNKTKESLFSELSDSDKSDTLFENFANILTEARKHLPEVEKFLTQVETTMDFWGFPRNSYCVIKSGRITFFRDSIKLFHLNSIEKMIESRPETLTAHNLYRLQEEMTTSKGYADVLGITLGDYVFLEQRKYFRSPLFQVSNHYTKIKKSNRVFDVTDELGKLFHPDIWNTKSVKMKTMFLTDEEKEIFAAPFLDNWMTALRYKWPSILSSLTDNFSLDIRRLETNFKNEKLFDVVISWLETDSEMLF